MLRVPVQRHCAPADLRTLIGEHLGYGSVCRGMDVE